MQAAQQQQFGPYALVRRLGRGGMAETFVATRVGPAGFAQEVCVKRILPALEEDPSFVAQFQDEARVSASLRHANVVSVLDFGVVDGSPFLVLELVDGMDLYSLLEWQRANGERMTPGLAVYLAAELASALEHAHGKRPQPVVHRDISPSNVLVSRAGEVKLSDFGIAKVLRGSRKATTTAMIKGKVPYMAPEYAMEGRFDPRCDLFALGVMLYEVLAGRRPYEGRTDLETLTLIQSGRRAPLADLVPGTMPALVSIVERLIEPSPDRRFASAADLLDALVEIAPPPTSRKILGDLVKRATGNRRSDASQPFVAATALAQGPRPAVASGGEPTPASASDPTRTRSPSGGVTDRTPVMDLGMAVSDPATTRTQLAPDVLDALKATEPSTESPALSDPSVRAAFEASQARFPETRAQPRSATGLWIAGGVALGVLLGVVLLALYLATR